MSLRGLRWETMWVIWVRTKFYHMPMCREMIPHREGTDRSGEVMWHTGRD